MKKIMFNDKYGLTEAVLTNKKTTTRRPVVGFPGCGLSRIVWREGLKHSKYKVGEIVAVAQPYCQVFNTEAKFRSAERKVGQILEAGYNNKMFVRADLMPHKIRINNVRIERLQDITDDECIREGIIRADYDLCGFRNGKHWETFRTAREAFIELIKRLYNREFWAKNSWVYVYEFELWE